jgi:hypothetical protein
VWVQFQEKRLDARAIVFGGEERRVGGYAGRIGSKVTLSKFFEVRAPWNRRRS